MKMKQDLDTRPKTVGIEKFFILKIDNMAFNLEKSRKGMLIILAAQINYLL